MNDAPPPAAEDQDSRVAVAREEAGTDVPVRAPALEVNQEPEQWPASASTEPPTIADAIAVAEEAPLRIPEEEASEVTPADPAAAKGRSVSSAKRRPSVPRLPETLSPGDIKAGVAPLLAAAKACGKKLYAQPGESVTIEFSILGTTGGVQSCVAEAPHKYSLLGACVAAALNQAKFKKFKKASIGARYRVKM